MVFIVTKLVAVFTFTKHPCPFLWSGWWAGQRPTERQKCPKTMYSKKCPFLQLILTSFVRDISLNVLHMQMSSQLGCHGNGDMAKQTFQFRPLKGQCADYVHAPAPSVFSSKDSRTVILTRQDFLPDHTTEGNLLFIFSSSILDFQSSLSSYLKFGSLHEDSSRFYR